MRPKISVWRVLCPRCQKGHVRVNNAPSLGGAVRPTRRYGVYDECLYCGTTQEEIADLLGQQEIPPDSEGLDGDKSRECSHFERELALCEVEFGAEHPSVAVASAKLGVLFWELGESVTARSYLEQAVTLFERLRGQSRPQLYAAMGALGSLYAAEKDFSRARVLYERLILLHEISHGPGHPV